MKKLFALILAAACALSVTALAACGEDKTGSSGGSEVSGSENTEGGTTGGSTGGSTGGNTGSEEETPVTEEVTETEWQTALAASNFYNVTLTMTGTENYTSTENGTSSSTGEIVVKADLEEDSNGKLIGSACSTTSSVRTANDGETTETTYNDYLKITYDSTDMTYYSYEVTDYSGSLALDYSFSTATGCAFDEMGISDYFSSIINCADSYDDFTYSEEEGVYTATVSQFTYKVIIADGVLKKFYLEAEYVESGSTETFSYEYTLTDYGTTSVEIPAEVSALMVTNASEELTADQLAEILAAEKYCNVTMQVNIGGDDYTYYYDLSADENGYVTGAIYSVGLNSSMYQIVSASGIATYVYEDGQWSYSAVYSETSETGYTLTTLDNIQEMIGELSEKTFTYTSDGYYCEAGDVTYTLIITDGALSSLIMAMSYGGSVSEYVYNFSDIDATSVTMPSELETYIESNSGTNE